MPPTLVHYATEAEYRAHYERCYCRVVIHTLDGLRVYFPRQQFDDAFFESANRRARDKSIFSLTRAERIDWIRAAIEDPAAELYLGWDRDKKVIAHGRRITLVFGNYVVVLQVSNKGNQATFVTAYVASPDTIRKIRSNPRW
ncbi:MAG: hypothetical protein WAW20_09210 [Anaerolineae bacterium]